MPSNRLSSAPNQRHFGMDLVRASAILLVLVGHGLTFFWRYYSVDWLLYSAVIGVELFFALSGFLIGNILIDLARGPHTLAATAVFWAKRWMRTVPAYLVVAVLIMLVDGRFYGSYLVFAQNWFPDQLQRFPVSWSLTIEEWFYLLFPLLMLAASWLLGRLGRHSAAGVVLAGALVSLVVPWLLRLAAIDPAGHWDSDIRQQIPLRLDAIAYGVLLALAYDRNPRPFTSGRGTVPIAAILLLGAAGLWWAYLAHIDIYRDPPNLFNSALFYPAVNLLAVAVVAYCIRFRRYPGGRTARAVLGVSLVSYSLYLIHFPIFNGLAARGQSEPQAWLYFLLALGIVFVLATILFLTVERPFIRLRRHLPLSGQVTTHLR